MAGLCLEPPKHFDFRKPDDWPRWKRRLKQYHSTSGLANEEQTRQVSTLLYCMGEEADDVLRSTEISDDDRKDYQKVLDQLDRFFDVRMSTIQQEKPEGRRVRRAVYHGSVQADRNLRLR